MSDVDVDNLQVIDPKGIELVPAAHAELKRVSSPFITLGELRDFALPRYRLQLASIGRPKGQAVADLEEGREAKDRAKVNQYSSAAFTSVAKRLGGWDISAKMAINAALLEANKLSNNRKPRAELNRALGHLKQLENKQLKNKRPGAKKVKTNTHKTKEIKPFAQLLSAAIKKKGVSILLLASKFETDDNKLYKWALGTGEPSYKAENLVKEIAVFLDLDPNELWNLRSRTKRIVWPADFPTSRKARARAIRKCPKLAGLSVKEQEGAIWKAYREPNREFDRKKKHRLSRNLHKWPRELAAELSAMLAVKRNRSEPVLPGWSV